MKQCISCSTLVKKIFHVGDCPRPMLFILPSLPPGPPVYFNFFHNEQDVGSTMNMKKANFLASLFKDFAIVPAPFIPHVNIRWTVRGVLPFKTLVGPLQTPAFVHQDIATLVDEVYKCYVIDRPIVCLEDGRQMQVTEDLTITFGDTPYQRAFK